MYHSMSQMWRLINLKVPFHIYRKFTINEDFTVETTHPRIQNTESSFRWKSTVTWNNLSEDIRCLQSLPTFKKHVNKWIIDRRVPDPVQNVVIEKLDICRSTDATDTDTDTNTGSIYDAETLS